MSDSSDLPSGYREWWAKLSGHLGGIYPFYNLETGKDCTLDISETIAWRRAQGLSVNLDPAGVACKACMPFLLGNRTLLQNVSRAPWMARPSADGAWKPVDLPPHGQCRPVPDAFVDQLKEALVDEASSYTGNIDTVGILLSGGMDSRVVAGVIREVQQRYEKPEKVVALTWGEEKSRDVVYASLVARRFGWERMHFPLNAETLSRNIKTAGLMGAEVSSLHLHAMPDIAEIGNVDAIVAGSYGDSVGRAEFSGRRLPKVKPVIQKTVDRFGVLPAAVRRYVMPILEEDASSDPHLHDVTNQIRRCEIEQEMHYMRRMLQSCMFVIARRIQFYQMFTAPTVFGLMWGLDPAVRDDSWYKLLLRKLPGDLLSIPWARTGRRYGSQTGAGDAYKKMYHAYGHWLRNDLKEIVLERVNSNRIRSLGIFTDRGLDHALRTWEKAKTRSTNSLDELISWIASLDIFIEQYGLEGPIADPPLRLSDHVRALKGRLYAEAYVAARNRFRE